MTSKHHYLVHVDNVDFDRSSGDYKCCVLQTLHTAIEKKLPGMILLNPIVVQISPNFQVGYDNLVQSGREFVREGCLQKLSRKGYQQRMFFLVSIPPHFLLLQTNRRCSIWLLFLLIYIHFNNIEL